MAGMDAIKQLGLVPHPAPSRAVPLQAVAPAAAPMPADSVQLGPSAPPAQASPTAKAVETARPAAAAAPQVDPHGPLAVLDTPQPRHKDEEFLAKYGPWGLVTGSSQGIGAEFARKLAESGMNLVLVARSEDKLQALARELRAEHGVQVRVLAQDLTRPEGLQAVQRGTADLEVGLLVNNAGMWQFGSFVENDIAKDVQSLALNLEAPMVLSHHFGKLMAERGRGGILNVGSGAGMHGVPGQAAYSASKAFLQNFTTSLYHELKPHGVDVLITNPGPVHGEASTAYDQTRVPLQKVTGREVATDALNRLGRGSTTIPGWFNKLAMSVAVRAMPRDLIAGVAGFILEKASPAGKAAPAEEAAPGPGKALAATSETTARSVAGAVLGGVWKGVMALMKPVKSVLATTRFATGFLGDMRRRAQEITEAPEKVEAHLKASGLHQEYVPPKNGVNTRFEGAMTIRANMSEFFELWDSWISKGYGSINDRQYADVVLKYRDQARELPLLRFVPMVSEDAFTAEIQDGRMTFMQETTTSRFAGLVPTNKVDWIYHRRTEPRASNSFERKIDEYDGDLAKVQAFYQDLFDPRKVNPESTATVDFVLRPVEELPKAAHPDREFTHSVQVPLGGVLPMPERTF